MAGIGAHALLMPDRDVQPGSITLSSAQVEAVVREASVVGSGLAALLADTTDDAERLRVLLVRVEGDARCSQSLVRALRVLNAFPRDGGERELSEIARELGLSPSTTHRYVTTWLLLGSLEQDSASRRYHRARARGGA